jgi:hypothetical protein
MLDGAAAMIVKLGVVVGANVPTGKHLLDVLEEVGIDRHEVLEMPVLRAILDHQDLAVPLDDLSLDLSDLLLDQHREIGFAVDDLVARLGHALRTERVRGPRPSQRWLGLLPGLEERFVRPLRCERRSGTDAIQSFEDEPSTVGYEGYSLFSVLDRSMHEKSTSLVIGRSPWREVKK